MSPRIVTECLWCFLALYVGSLWSPVRCVTVRAPPSNPATVEAQAKFFQYRHLPTHEDFDQGHRLGSERHFTERHERSRPSAGLFSAKVRWGDKKGGYGEHYWDLNHAGHNNDHDHDDGYEGDDGSYHEDSDPYDEPSDNSPTYGTEEYNPEKASYEDASRTKRAHPKVKVERKNLESDELPKKHDKELKTAASHRVQTDDTNRKYHDDDGDYQRQNQKKQVVLVVSHKDRDANQANQFVPKKQPESNHYVPYEGGAGVREHQAEATSVPRLFLEPSTGHVVDRATGQAYVLQPILNN